ncbi:MAG: CoA ester lyase [Candidatus Izemoplasmatales bacterium]|nr:CoA ester lyase [Candidatus Izemoplasmatales bacterium]
MNRSYLFVPGNNPSMIQTADVFGADAVIFDLEDSVHVNEKDNARSLVHDYLMAHPVLPKKVVIRINAMNSPFFEADLNHVLSDRIDAILLPKARRDDIVLLKDIMKQIASKKRLTKPVKIIALVELASSLLEVESIVAIDGVEGVLFGAEDFASDMEIKRSESGEEIFYPRARIACACKAYGIEAIDTPYTDVLNDEGLIQDALKAQGLGMTGKAAIHPRHIEAIHTVFSPSKDQILWARKVLHALKEAKDKGLGVFSLDGKMIDKPIIDRAKTIIHKAQVYGLVNQDE